MKSITGRGSSSTNQTSARSFVPTAKRKLKKIKKSERPKNIKTPFRNKKITKENSEDPNNIDWN